MDLPLTELIAPEGPVAFSRLRTISAAHAGRDPSGKVIPHVRSEEVALVVAQMAAVGTPINTIAVALNIRPGQLKRCYGNELEHAPEIANSKVAIAAFQMASSGKSEQMTKFWLKARNKWRDGENSDDKAASLFNIHIHA